MEELGRLKVLCRRFLQLSVSCWWTPVRWLGTETVAISAGAGGATTNARTTTTTTTMISTTVPRPTGAPIAKVLDNRPGSKTAETTPIATTAVVV